MASAAGSNPEFSPNGSDSGDEMHDVMFAKRGCCIWMPIFVSDRSNTSGSKWWERINNSREEKEEKWWSKGLRVFMKVREWSELVAGPRWKTFIRQFNRSRMGSGLKKGGFKYDPLSYALNFDDGPDQNSCSEDDRARRDFSSRYAAIPVSAKSAADLGRDARFT